MVYLSWDAYGCGSVSWVGFACMGCRSSLCFCFSFSGVYFFFFFFDCPIFKQTHFSFLVFLLCLFI